MSNELSGIDETSGINDFSREKMNAAFDELLANPSKPQTLKFVVKIAEIVGLDASVDEGTKVSVVKSSCADCNVLSSLRLSPEPAVNVAESQVTKMEEETESLKKKIDEKSVYIGKLQERLAKLNKALLETTFERVKIAIEESKSKYIKAKTEEIDFAKKKPKLNKKKIQDLQNRINDAKKLSSLELLKISTSPVIAEDKERLLNKEAGTTTEVVYNILNYDGVKESLSKARENVYNWDKTAKRLAKAKMADGEPGLDKLISTEVSEADICEFAAETTIDVTEAGYSDLSQKHGEDQSQKKREVQKISAQEKEFEKKIAEGQLEHFAEAKAAVATAAPATQHFPTSSSATVSNPLSPSSQQMPSSSGSSRPVQHKASKDTSLEVFDENAPSTSSGIQKHNRPDASK